MKMYKKIMQFFLFAGIGIVILSLLGGVPKLSDETNSETAVISSPAAFSPAITTNLDDYLWPINSDQRITSTFAEFRSTHFHGGVDIGTHDKIGVEVYAARNGYVARVSVSPYGYGRFLVLRHPDGYYTTYAHLHSFNPMLERLVHEEQLRKGKFSIELKFAPGEIAVRKGELVAYSGESGEGSAHLHFEVRDEKFNPVNPFLCPDIKESDDTQPPIFRQLAVVPLDANSLVDYEFAPQLFRPQYIKRGVYKISEVIRCTGMTGFEIDAQDKSPTSRYMRGVYQVQFQVDGQTLFQSARNKFPADETREIGLEYDWSLWREHRGEFEKLYLDQGNTLPFYSSTSLYDGAISPRKIFEGMHTFRILATDFSGNISELSGTFVLNHPPAVEILGAAEKQLYVVIPNLGKVHSVKIETRKLSAKKWHAEEYDAKDLTIGHDSLLIPLDRESCDVVRVTAKNIWGTTSFPSYFFFKQPRSAARVWIEKKFADTFLKISVCADAPLTNPPVVEVQQGKIIANVAVHAVNETRYDGVYKLSDSYSGTSFIKAFCETGRQRAETFDSFEINSITPEQGGTISSDDGNFIAEFPAGAVYAPVHLYVKKIDEATYSIEPRDQLLRGSCTVTLRYPALYDERGKLALYMKDRGEWNFTRAQRDASTHTFVLQQEHSLGEFGIFTDTKTPVIRRWNASHYNTANRSLFSFSVRDNFSGVDADEINIFMNGERVIPEYNPEKHRVSFIPFEPVPRGRYTVSIEVRDRAGNAAHETKSLTVFR
jgi:hypothetical protein